jgi:hypothetical protein
LVLLLSMGGKKVSASPRCATTDECDSCGRDGKRKRLDYFTVIGGSPAELTSNRFDVANQSAHALV